MKFDELYNRVFIAEENTEEVADPAKFNDVEPAPLPEPSASPEVETSTRNVESSATLNDYTIQLDKFAHELNNTEGTGLQVLISKLDHHDTPFQGMSGLKNKIVSAAKALRDVSEDIKSFIVYAAKK